MNRGAPEWVVYTREGCGLCGEFLADLAASVGEKTAALVRVVDIESDANLLRKYKDRIPVLTIGGDFVCGYRLDRERLRPYLDDLDDSNALKGG